MDIENKLRIAIQQAFIAEFALEMSLETLPLQPTRKEFEGDYTLVTFSFQSSLEKNPNTIGQSIGYFLKYATNMVEDYNVVNGFLNIKVKTRLWMEHFMAFQKLGVNHSPPLAAHSACILVESPGPNTNKPLHVGHLRNMVLGNAMAQIFKALGNKVYSVNIFNDRGIHICKSMAAYEQFGAEETPASTGLKGDFLVGKYYVLFEQVYRKQVEDLLQQGIPLSQAEAEAPLFKSAKKLLLQWEENNPVVRALWEKMNGWVYEGLEKTFQAVGMHIDRHYYESNTYLLGKQIVEEGLQKGVFYKKDAGSVWVDLQEEGLDEKLLLRADGTAVYITQDLGTVDLYYQDYAFDQCIYVVGNEQDYHFKVLFAILKKLGRAYATRLHHLSYGMVDLPHGKMKSREGTVVDADQLVQEVIQTVEHHSQTLGSTIPPADAARLHTVVGLGALKYFLVRIDPQKRILFDANKSVDFQGDTGPFIQYTHARIHTLLQKALPQDLAPEGVTAEAVSQCITASERNLVLQLCRYSYYLQEAARTYNPSIMAHYALTLAKQFNKLYAEVHILKTEDSLHRRWRLYLAGCVALILKNTLALLGIEAPNHM